MCFGCNDIRFYTHVHGLVHSVLSLQHKICILQVTIECCGNLATKLCVGPLCSPVQPSLSGWPQQTDDASRFDDASQFGFYLICEAKCTLFQADLLSSDGILSNGAKIFLVFAICILKNNCKNGALIIALFTMGGVISMETK